MKISGLAPLILVFDVPAAIRFYRDGLGFAVVETSRPADPDEHYTWVLLERDGVQLMLEPLYPAAQKPAVPDPVRVATHADTILYLGCPDVDAAYHELRAKGVEVSEPVATGYGFKALYCQDPDGFRIVLHWPQTETIEA